MRSDEKYRVIVIDDEKDIRKELINALNESIEFEVVGEADSVSSAYQVIAKTEADLIFLDIKLKEGDAFQLLHKLRRAEITIPFVVLNTGYQEFEYAQRSLNEFRDEVLMILKKPFWENWHQKEQEILLKLSNIDRSPVEISDKKIIRFKVGHTSFRLQTADLIVIRTHPEGKGKGLLQVLTQESSYKVYENIKDIIRHLPADFMQINRNTIVNLNYVVSYNHVEKLAKLKHLPQEDFIVTKKHQKEFESYL
jgi:two-component system LytT family response regulator